MTSPNVAVGRRLPEITKYVTQDQVDAYARASGDFNPIHLDEDFAVTTQFGTRIAHGMLILAFISEMMSTAFPESWPASGTLKVRFRAPVYPGETVTAFGEVTAVECAASSRQVIRCRVGCRKPDGTEAISGQASVVASGIR